MAVLVLVVALVLVAVVVVVVVETGDGSRCNNNTIPNSSLPYMYIQNNKVNSA